MRALRPALAGLLICCAAGLVGQTGREAYRQEYDAWRQAQTTLERDAGTGTDAMLPQVDRAASLASAFGAERAAYVKSAIVNATEQRRVLQAAATGPSPDLAPAVLAERVAGDLQTITKNIARFANDRDSGIQQLRLSLNRERDALAALDESIKARQKAIASTTESVAVLEQARGRTAEAFELQTSLLADSAGQLDKENAAWAEYYEKLARGIQLASAPPTPVSVAIPSPEPRTETAPAIPLARYVGAWTYPIVNGSYHGNQPEFVDLVIHHENGHVDGTLFGRFKVPPGTMDPLVRFDFTGDLANAPSQRFALVTSGDVKGTLELIPGPAFNLLEVNFRTDPSTDKITSGNFILVKK